MSTLACKEVIGQLLDYIDGDMEQGRKADVEQHLQNCPFCRGLMKSYEKTINLLKKSHQVEPDREMIDRVRNYVDARLSKPSH